MDNAADFLKTSFAVLIFIIAISVTFSMVSKVTTASRTILKNSDRNTYFRPMTEAETAKSRKVTNETVISMINRIEQESFCIKVIDGNLTWFFDIENSKIEDNGTITEKTLDEIINEYMLNTINEQSTFNETFTEQVYEGVYKTADDGTTLVIHQGAAKLHITYTKEN